MTSGLLVLVLAALVSAAAAAPWRCVGGCGAPTVCVTNQGRPSFEPPCITIGQPGPPCSGSAQVLTPCPSPCPCPCPCPCPPPCPAPCQPPPCPCGY